MSEKVAEERHHLGAVDRVLMDSEVEAAGGSHPADRRILGPPSMVDEAGDLPHQSTGLGGIRDEREAALAGEYHYDASPSGVSL